MASFQTIAGYPGLLPALRIATVSSMLFISGLSFCLSVWVIPNLFLVPPPMQTKQFTATVEKGARYLMRASRTMMFSLILTTLLTATHPDPLVSADWTSWAILGCVLICAAPYEIYFIFPINDAVFRLNRQIEKDKQALTVDQETELRNYLDKWAFRNFGRVIIPFVVGVIGMCNL